MSDLQIILILLGAMIIAAVVIYNWLQEKKLRENITEDFIVPQKDVLVEEFYVDTDALVDKEFADDTRKDEIIKKLNEGGVEKKEPSLNENALPEVEAEIPVSITEAPSETKNEEIAPEKENVEEAPQAKEAQPEIEVTKDILPPEFDPVATTSLPDDVHSQIDLTAFLYA